MTICAKNKGNGSKKGIEEMEKEHWLKEHIKITTAGGGTHGGQEKDNSKESDHSGGGSREVPSEKMRREMLAINSHNGSYYGDTAKEKVTKDSESANLLIVSSITV